MRTELGTGSAWGSSSLPISVLAHPEFVLDTNFLTGVGKQLAIPGTAEYNA